MRRVQPVKILILSLLVISFASISLGCENITRFDKNQNSYITEPYNTVDESTQQE